MFRALPSAVVLLAAATVAAPASAATAPSVPDAAVLAHAGLTVRWPVTTGISMVQPLARLRVVVRSTSRRAPAALVTFSRVDSDGRPLRRIAARRLRDGRLTATVPGRSGRHYTLSIRVGHHRWSSRLDTVAGPGSCPSTGTASGTLTLTPRTLTSATQPLRYTLTNTGTRCMAGGYGGAWQRLADGVWQDVPDLRPVPTILILLNPGRSWTGQTTLPEDAPPGHYRFTPAFWPSPPTAPPSRGFAPAQFDYFPPD